MISREFIFKENTKIKHEKEKKNIELADYLKQTQQ